MKTQELQDNYDLYIQDGEFKKNFQHLLTKDFLEWWFEQIPLPHESGWDHRTYFDRMSWMLIGWLGNKHLLKQDHMETLLAELSSKLGFTVELEYDSEKNEWQVRSGNDKPPEKEDFQYTFKTRGQVEDWLHEQLKEE